MTELTNKEIFQNLFGHQSYLPFNKRILLLKIRRCFDIPLSVGVAKGALPPRLEEEVYSADLYLDVFLYENYEELVEWCNAKGKTIQYLD